MSYRCGNEQCKAIVKPHIKRAEFTRVVEYRNRKIYVPRRNLDTPPAIRNIKEIVKEVSFCPDCALQFDINSINIEKVLDSRISNVVRIHK